MGRRNDCVVVLAVLPASRTVVPVMIAISNRVPIPSVTHVPIGPVGRSGLSVPPRVVPVSERNNDHVMVRMSPRVTHVMDRRRLTSPVSLAMVNSCPGRPGPVVRPHVAKRSKRVRPDTLVICQTTRKLSRVICWSVVIRCPGPIGPDVRPRVSLVANNAVMAGLVAIRMMSLKVDHVKLVMVSTRIGLHGRHVPKHVRVAINNVFDRIHVVNLTNVVFAVSSLNHRHVVSKDNGRCGRTTRHVHRHVLVAQ